MYGSGASGAAGICRVWSASWLAGIISEDTKSLAAAGSKSAAGTSVLASGEPGS
jgi:hypothetical protein